MAETTTPPVEIQQTEVPVAVIEQAPAPAPVDAAALVDQAGSTSGAIRGLADGEGLPPSNAGHGSGEGNNPGASEGANAGAGQGGGGERPPGEPPAAAPEDDDPPNDTGYDANGRQIPIRQNEAQAAATSTTEELVPPPGAGGQAEGAPQAAEAGGNTPPPTEAGTATALAEAPPTRREVVDGIVAEQANAPTVEMRMERNRKEQQDLEKRRQALIAAERRKDLPERQREMIREERADLEDRIDALRIQEQGLEVEQLSETNPVRDEALKKKLGETVFAEVKKMEAKQLALIKAAQELPVRSLELIAIKKKRRAELKKILAEQGNMKAADIVEPAADGEAKEVIDARNGFMLVCQDIVNNRFAAVRYAMEYNHIATQIADITGERNILVRLGRKAMHMASNFVLDRVISNSIKEEMKRDTGNPLNFFRNPVGTMARAGMAGTA